MTYPSDDFRNVSRPEGAETGASVLDRLLDEVLASVSDGVFLLDEFGRFLRFNTSLTRILRGSPSEWIGRRAGVSLPPDKRREILRLFLRARAGEEVRIELQTPVLDGTFRDLHVTLRPLSSPMQPLVLGVVRDATDVRAAQEATKATRISLESILRAAPTGIALLQDRTFCWVSRQLIKMTGFTQDEWKDLEEQSLYESEQDYARVGAILDDAMHWKQTRETDTRWRIKDGTSIDIHLRATPVDLNHASKGLIISVLDITDRKRNEYEIERRRKYLEAVLRDAPDAIVTLDADHRIIEWNPAAEEIFGFTRDEAVGRDPDDLIALGEVAQEARRITRHVLQGRKIAPFEAVRYRKDGTPVHVTVSGSPIKTGDRLQGIVALYTDLTAHRRLELQLQQAQKLEDIGTLAGGVAHDFNNLLTGIQGRVSLMLMNAKASHPGYEHLKSIEDHTRSATELTRQLLGFATQSGVETRPTDLNAVIRKSVSMFGRTRKEIQIHTLLQEDLPLMEADPGQVEQVLLNLYVNAWQAMPSGGDLYVETRSTRLDQDAARPLSLHPGPYVCISVRDTGVGMDEAMLQRIFDPFFTTKKRDRGTGLGLASAYGIITRHRGAIRVRSRKGDGAEFTIHLPVAVKQLQEGEPTPGAPSLLGE